MTELKIHIPLDGDGYALITKGETYGFKVSVFTPTAKEDAKHSHRKDDYFYPDLEQVSKKIVWLGAKGIGLSSFMMFMKKTEQRVKGALDAYFAYIEDRENG